MVHYPPVDGSRSRMSVALCWRTIWLVVPARGICGVNRATSVKCCPSRDLRRSSDATKYASVVCGPQILAPSFAFIIAGPPPSPPSPIPSQHTSTRPSRKPAIPSQCSNYQKSPRCASHGKSIHGEHPLTSTRSASRASSMSPASLFTTATFP
jgi:hypothetical protein